MALYLKFGLYTTGYAQHPEENPLLQNVSSLPTGRQAYGSVKNAFGY